MMPRIAPWLSLAVLPPATPYGFSHVPVIGYEGRSWLSCASAAFIIVMSLFLALPLRAWT
jgi:hypothetical protein